MCLRQQLLRRLRPPDVVSRASTPRQGRVSQGSMYSVMSWEVRAQSELVHQPKRSADPHESKRLPSCWRQCLPYIACNANSIQGHSATIKPLLRKSLFATISHVHHPSSSFSFGNCITTCACITAQMWTLKTPQQPLPVIPHVSQQAVKRPRGRRRNHMPGNLYLQLGSTFTSARCQG